MHALGSNGIEVRTSSARREASGFAVVRWLLTKLPAEGRSIDRRDKDLPAVSAETLAAIDEVQKSAEDRIRGGFLEYWDHAGGIQRRGTALAIVQAPRSAFSSGSRSQRNRFRRSAQPELSTARRPPAVRVYADCTRRVLVTFALVWCAAIPIS